MSRIGRSPIPIPSGVDVSVSGNHITVKGPKATLQSDFHPEMTVSIQDGVLTVSRPTDARTHRALHGLTRSLTANMVQGVTEGLPEVLEIQGVGYRAADKRKNIQLAVGHSHPVPVAASGDISVAVETPK